MPERTEPEETRAGEAAPAETAEALPTTTTFESARRMVESGKSVAEVKQALMAQGLDEESARVVVNSLPGATQPSTLPEPTVSLSTNALALSICPVSAAR